MKLSGRKTEKWERKTIWKKKGRKATTGLEKWEGRKGREERKEEREGG